MLHFIFFQIIYRYPNSVCKSILLHWSIILTNPLQYLFLHNDKVDFFQELYFKRQKKLQEKFKENLCTKIFVNVALANYKECFLSPNWQQNSEMAGKFYEGSVVA